MLRRMLPVVTFVPFDWPRFLRNAAPSPFFAEFAAARNTSRLPVEDARTDPFSTMTARPHKDALLHQVSFKQSLAVIPAIFAICHPVRPVRSRAAML